MADLAVGVIGAGGMGARHALNLHHHVVGARVAAIYDLDQRRAQQVAATCGAPQVFDDPLQLIEDDHVDAVVIASPDATHVEYVLHCLRHRKPMLCEKPLAITAADALRIVEAECALDRRLVAVGFMRRFDPQHLAVRNAVEAGQIGRALLFKGVHRNAVVAPTTSGAMVITSSASHDIDAARWLLGQEIEEVYVCGVRTRATFSEQTRDLLLLQMALRDDRLATVEVFVAAEYGYEVGAEIVGERGTAVTMQPAGALVRAQAARSVAVPLDWIERFQPAYVAELQAWIDALCTGQVFPGADAWDGYMSLLVIDACIRSLHEGTPVAVPTPARPDFYSI
jgi:myo-inositol 2-dehydrogenase/D-chiro-inositol 1-dehydrogenase